MRQFRWSSRREMGLRSSRPGIAVLILLLLCSCFSTSCFAQESNGSTSLPVQLLEPYTVFLNLTSGASATLTIAPLTSLQPVQIILSVCSPPSSWTRVPADFATTNVLYASNDSSITTSPGPNDGVNSSIYRTAMLSNYRAVPLSYGFANVSMLSTAAGGGITITIHAPTSSEETSTSDNVWTFSLALTSVNSTNLVVLVPRAGYRVQGTDSTSALLTTGNFSSASSLPNTTSVFARTTDFTTAFGRSSCFVRDGLARVDPLPAQNINQSTAPAFAMDGFQIRYLLQGLSGGTNYTSWLIETTLDGIEIFYEPNYFVTQTTTSCRLITDIPLCPMVAYSVPAPLGVSTDALINFYSTNITNHLNAFNRTLSTFPCSDPTQGRYSPVSNCQSCLAAYTTWLCAVSFPRCADAPSNASLLPTYSDQWILPSIEDTSYAVLRDNPPASRTPLLSPENLPGSFQSLVFNSSFTTQDSTPFPYTEVPPCLDSVCELVGARCPPLIGWSCPRAKGSMGRSDYGQLAQLSDPSQRQWGWVQGVNELDWKSWDSDRFGNVYCNSLGSDQLLARQFVLTPNNGS